MMKPLIAGLALMMGMGCGFGQTKGTGKAAKIPDVFDKNDCNVTALGAEECARSHQDEIDFRKKLDEDVWPRDIFACHEAKDCSKPIRGWKLMVIDNMEYDGSIDSDTSIWQFSKNGKKRYFWIYNASGVDQKNGQSVVEFRVKQLGSANENPYETYSMRNGWWALDRSYVWEPFEDDPKSGSCSEHPLQDLGSSRMPTTKEECENEAAGMSIGLEGKKDYVKCHRIYLDYRYKETSDSKDSACPESPSKAAVPVSQYDPNYETTSQVFLGTPPQRWKLRRRHPIPCVPSHHHHCYPSPKKKIHSK